jgi:hypothetical protein
MNTFLNLDSNAKLQDPGDHDCLYLCGFYGGDRYWNGFTPRSAAIIPPVLHMHIHSYIIATNYYYCCY